jgi:hypothetical protein
MRDMFPMHHGMTVRANDDEIREIIVMPIMINMMNSKNFFAFIKSAFLAFLKHSSSDHIFSDGAENSFPRKFRLFSNTVFRTENSFFAWRIEKCLAAMFAFEFNLIIVFCLNAFNFRNTHRFSHIFSQVPKTFARASNSFMLPVRLYLKRFFTVFAVESYHAA